MASSGLQTEPVGGTDVEHVVMTNKDKDTVKEEEMEMEKANKTGPGSLKNSGNTSTGNISLKGSLNMSQPNSLTQDEISRQLEAMKQEEAELTAKLEKGQKEKEELERLLRKEKHQERELEKQLKEIKEKEMELMRRMQIGKASMGVTESAEIAYKSVNTATLNLNLRKSLNPELLQAKHKRAQQHGTMAQGHSHPDARPVFSHYNSTLLNKKYKNKKMYKTQKIGKVITKEDESYELMFDMLLGIRMTVSKETAKVVNRAPQASDFKKKIEYNVPSRGSNITPAHPCRDFKFRDYAPFIFRLLRNKFKIDSADYLMSLTNDYILSEIVSPGKSGSFFYFSHDSRFMLKTITNFETKFLKKILPSYYKHVINNPNTLLVRFFGFHSVKPHNGKRYHFVVMGNIFAQCLPIHERYDLKGSTVGRTVGEIKKKDPNIVMKDLDLNERKFCLGPEKRTQLMDQLERDCNFLVSKNIMDYSLLIGIHKVYAENDDEVVEEENDNIMIKEDDKKEEELEYEKQPIFTRDAGGFCATDESNNLVGEIYFLGIIDILQPFNLKKRLEHNFKSLSQPKDEISAVEPVFYATRFKEFISQHISTEDAHKIRFLEEWIQEKEQTKEEKKRKKKEHKKNKKIIKQQAKVERKEGKRLKKEEKAMKREEEKERKREEKARKKGSKLAVDQYYEPTKREKRASMDDISFLRPASEKRKLNSPDHILYSKSLTTPVKSLAADSFEV